MLFQVVISHRHFHLGTYLISFWFQVCFIRANFNDLNLPKARLHAWAGKNDLKLPLYNTQQVEKLFRTILSFNGKKYTSSFWEKNKKFAEQGAALVCLNSLGIVNDDELLKLGSTLY